MEGFLILFAFVIAGCSILFVVTTLTRLTSNEELISRLENELKELKNRRFPREKPVIKAAKEHEAEDRSEIGERFEEAKERTERAAGITEPIDPKIGELDAVESAVDEETESVTPPPLPVAAERAANAQKAEAGAKAVVVSDSKPVEKPEPIVPEGPSKWQQILEKIYLWPPSGDTAAEATIVGWWTIRLGLIVGIIGATFAGIYVAKDVGPWVRVLAMSGVSVGVVFLGLWLEKRLAGFGRLVVAGGLGLGYFTAFAAFALQPMQVISSPELALLVQAAVVVVMVVWSLWRDDELVAGMGTLLGYVSCWFSYRHDQMDFVVVGLLTLGAAAAFLLWKKRWLWPQVFAVAGTWIGFFVLGIFEWNTESAPHFGVLLACMVGAAVIFEAASFFTGPSIDIESEKAKWLRRLSVVASSAAILVGYLVIEESYPDQDSWFFLTMAVVTLGFSAAHFFRKHGISRGLDQMFFLKASALLCLFFVAEFDGPVRWFSLAAQVGAVLLVWKQTRYRWVEIGFAALFLVAVGTQIRDLLVESDDVIWKFFSARNVVGLASMTALSFWLTLYRTWRFPLSEKQPERDAPENPVYLLGAILVALGAWLLAGRDVLGNAHAPLFAMVAGLAVASPLILWRRLAPLLSGALVLVAAFAATWIGSDDWPFSNAMWTSAAAVVLAVGVSEWCRRNWASHWVFGNAFRAVFSGLSIVIFVKGISIAARKLDSFAFDATGLLLAAGLGFGLLWHLSKQLPEGVSTREKSTHIGWQWGLAVVIGIFVAGFGVDLIQEDFRPILLVIAAAILGSVAFFTRNGAPTAAVGFPLVFGVFSYLDTYGMESDVGNHAIVALCMLVVLIPAIVVIWRSTRHLESQPLVALELVLLIISVAVAHWFFRNVFPLSGVLAIDSLLALGMLVISRIQPMRILKGASGLPIGYAILHIIGEITQIHSNDPGSKLWWWCSAVFAAVWAWLYFQGKEIRLPNLLGRGGESADPDRVLTFAWPTALLTVVFGLVAGHAVSAPWKAVAFVGFGLVLLIMWLRAGVKSGQMWTWFLMAIGGLRITYQIVNAPDSEAGLIELFTVAVIVALLFLIHGVFHPRKIEEYRTLAIFQAIPALALVFYASYPGVLMVENLTTVCWGVASIVIFIFGLIAGLKVYRIVGLVGLGLALARVFVVDLDDTLYRIFASFAVAIVLMIVSYLYHRFRHRIEAIGITSDD